jgi:hypothetical protein
MLIDLRKDTVAGFVARMTRYRTYAVSALSAVGPAGTFALRNADASALVLFVSVVAASAFLIPKQVRAGIDLENWISLRRGLLVPGRLIRGLVVLPSILIAAVFLKLPYTPDAGFLFLSIGAGTGIFAIAATLAFRGIGDRTTNAVYGCAATFWVMTLESLSTTHLAALVALLILSASFLLDVCRGAVSDIRGRHPRDGGVGVFFGTFNPVHRTHVDIIRRAIVERNLERVYVHPTTVPKLHRVALSNGEIDFDHRDGMRVYRRTERADPNKNYFPTGNMFFEYELRNELLKASIQDEDLQDRVTVLELPRLYETDGFLGIARRIRTENPGQPIHGLHGSDPGGMWVRNLFEACGGIIPCPVLRRDEVSATAIRKGGVGMTTPTVERFLAAVRASRGFAFPNGFVFEPIGARPPEEARTIGLQQSDHHGKKVEAVR